METNKKDETLASKLDDILYAGLSVPNRRVIRQEVEMGKKEILDVVEAHVKGILTPKPLDSAQIHKMKMDLIAEFERKL